MHLSHTGSGRYKTNTIFPVLRECTNSAENVAVVEFFLILCDNMDIFDGFRPSTIFYYIERLFIL